MCANNRIIRAPAVFKPPVVRKKEQGEAAFHAYDWYFEQIKDFLISVDKVFLTPCAATKPICSSSMHRSIYQKYIAVKGIDREIFVVSEPVVLIYYEDLYDLEKHFLYDFPPCFLSTETRAIFISRLMDTLSGKDIEGCLPKHHAGLIDDAVGKNNWKNYWQGDMLDMMKRANQLR